MKTAIWHHQWVIGLYALPEQAERVITAAETEGVSPDKLVVIAPETFTRKRLRDIRPQRRHPEFRWMRNGAIIGFIVGSLLGYVFLTTTGVTSDPAVRTLTALIMGFGIAIIGYLLGLLSSSADASLNAWYEESGVEGKILVGISCHPKRQAEVAMAQRLIRQSGVEPREFPRLRVA